MELPEAFIIRTKFILGEEWEAFEKALDENSPVSIRLNTAKMLSVENSDLNIQSPVSWASDAYYLDSRPSFTLDPLFHAGGYYVQEASSMYLEQIINKQIPNPVICLDLCAAPGGKSTQLLSVLPEGSLLIANEVIRSRSNILAENIIKWGYPNAIVTNNDPATIGNMDHLFDLIVADVPCSGEGMFRKDPGAIKEWSVNNVQLCAERQRRIIADIWPSLKQGGILVYSTCTYNREENEDNIEWICRELGAEMIETPHRFIPHQTRGEGFFITAVQKSSLHQPISRNDRKMNNKKKEKSESFNDSKKILHSWLVDPDQLVITKEGDHFLAIPTIHYETYRTLKESLKIITAGITLGEQKGKDLIPSHSLAMSNSLSKNTFPILELEKEAALHYLRKEALQAIPDDLPKGYVLITYKQHPLGFIKNIGNRANNLYPQEWRIRSGNIPNETVGCLFI